MDKVFDELAVPIKIYIAHETETDPFEHTVEETLINPIPIRAIVTEISSAKAQWTMPGIVTEKSKQIYCKKIHRHLLEMSQKITVRGDSSEYYGYRVNGRMSIIEVGDLVRCYIYVKKES